MTKVTKNREVKALYGWQNENSLNVWIWLYKFYVETLTFLKGALHLRREKKKENERKNCVVCS